jgi:hypothetical protein
MADSEDALAQYLANKPAAGIVWRRGAFAQVSSILAFIRARTPAPILLPSLAEKVIAASLTRSRSRCRHGVCMTLQASEKVIVIGWGGGLTERTS